MNETDIDARFRNAIRSCWATRLTQEHKQGQGGVKDAGQRSAVTGGQHMDAVSRLLSDIIIEAGIPETSVFHKRAVEIPGYYRAEKKWDLIAVHDSTLVCAVELKSQAAPSFGNNFNNRAEEAIGSAKDVWTAFRENRFGNSRRPWLGYLFLLEDCEESSSPVGVREPHFLVDPVFRGASYKKRYEILCRRLVLERLYDAAAFVTSTRDAEVPVIAFPDRDLSFSRFSASLRGHVHAFVSS